MPRARPLRLTPEWDDRFTRMLAVSAALHVAVIVAVIVLAPLGKPRPLPLVAYTVELTDPNALGGRTPPGAPGRDLTGGPTAPPPGGPPAAKPEPAPPPPEPEQVAKSETPPSPTPEAKAPEPKAELPPEPAPREPPKPEQAVQIPEEPKPPPAPKPEPKPEPKPPPKPEPPKPAPKPAPKAEPKPPPKPEPKPPPKPEAKPAPKPEPPRTATATAPKPGAKPAPSARGGGEPAEQAPHDAYGASADRWRSRAAGGGLGGSDTGSGPIGAGGEGKGGGGQLVGLEFLAYRQQVINTVKSRWTNVIARPGLVARVRFEIAPDGSVSGARIEQSSGNAAYDSSALRAVEHANPLPPPPARYASEFRDFVIEFHSEETGGQGTG